MGTKRYAAIAIAAALAVTMSVSAIAAKPKAGHYVDGNKNKITISLDVVKSKKKLTPSYYNKCSPVPVIYKAKIKPNGKFKYEGSVKNVVDENVDIDLHGKFVNKKTAEGTVSYSTKDCNGKAEDFVATYQNNG